MTGDAAAIEHLASYLTGAEAREMALRLEAGHPLSLVLRGVAAARQGEVRSRLDASGLSATPAVLAVACRAVAGANARATSVQPVWTAPGNLVGHGSLTSSLHHYVTRARVSVTCSTFNFQESSALWPALQEAAARTEVMVNIYMDTAAADRNTRYRTRTTQEVADEMRGAVVWRTRHRQGRLVRNHAKFVAVDHRYLVVTSANFSLSAEEHNVELGLVVENPPLIQSVERQLAELERSVYEVVRRR